MRQLRPKQSLIALACLSASAAQAQTACGNNERGVTQDGITKLKPGNDERFVTMLKVDTVNSIRPHVNFGGAQMSDEYCIKLADDVRPIHIGGGCSDWDYTDRKLRIVLSGAKHPTAGAHAADFA